MERLGPIGAPLITARCAFIRAAQKVCGFHAATLVKAVQDSPVWKDSVIIITYDEGGGRWDHVPPPSGDRWGPGVRVPAVIISPYAKRAFIDHTTYETTSILKLIQARWNLPPLGPRDAAANNLLNAFDFSQNP